MGQASAGTDELRTGDRTTRRSIANRQRVSRADRHCEREKGFRSNAGASPAHCRILCRAPAHMQSAGSAGKSRLLRVIYQNESDAQAFRRKADKAYQPDEAPETISAAAGIFDSRYQPGVVDSHLPFGGMELLSGRFPTKLSGLASFGMGGGVGTSSGAVLFNRTAPVVADYNTVVGVDPDIRARGAPNSHGGPFFLDLLYFSRSFDRGRLACAQVATGTDCRFDLVVAFRISDAAFLRGVLHVEREECDEKRTGESGCGSDAGRSGFPGDCSGWRADWVSFVWRPPWVRPGRRNYYWVRKRMHRNQRCFPV